MIGQTPPPQGGGENPQFFPSFHFMGSENISLLDKLIAIFDPHTKEGRINIFRLAWIVGLFMLVLGYLIIIFILFFT